MEWNEIARGSIKRKRRRQEKTRVRGNETCEKRKGQI